MSEALADREIIIEFRPMGAIVRVSAMDTKSLIEVSIQGPANAGEQLLKRNVLRKLEYVLKKRGILPPDKI